MQQYLSLDKRVKMRQRNEAWQAFDKLKALLWLMAFIVKAMRGVVAGLLTHLAFD